jgi:hypothetical protein
VKRLAQLARPVFECLFLLALMAAWTALLFVGADLLDLSGWED